MLKYLLEVTVNLKLSNLSRSRKCVYRLRMILTFQTFELDWDDKKYTFDFKK